MSFSELLRNLLQDTAGRSLTAFGPELILCGTIVVLLLGRLFNLDRRIPSHSIALLGAILSFFFALYQFANFDTLVPGGSQPLFTGLLLFDQFTVFFRLFLLLFLVLMVTLTVFSGIPDNDDGPDFYTLLLGATIGLMLMASANHLLILFLGVEMTSVPSYAMVGFMKGRRISSEAALKYVVSGAGAAGVMLYGISLLAGLLGTGVMWSGTEPMLAERFALIVGSDAGAISSPEVRTLLFAVLLILVGLAFKLSLVPFHFWCPDAFEGASAEVAAFLSVASKAGAFALLVRFCIALTGADIESTKTLLLPIGIALGVIAAITATFGNLAAYSQTNIKRLLAYSTIAHAGYMLMAVAAMMVLINAPVATVLGPHGVRYEAMRCLEGLLYYLLVYLFMNLGAFAIVALIRNHIFSEEIEDYRGLVFQSPVLCVCMLVCLFSLVGVPPFAGFFAKWMIFSSLYQAGMVHWSMWIVLGVGGLNTVISLFYYLRVLKAMFLYERPEGARRFNVRFGSTAASYAMLVTAPILAMVVVPLVGNGVSALAQDVAAGLFHQ